jgi:uncharacterized membrane protein YqjE
MTQHHAQQQTTASGNGPPAPDNQSIGQLLNEATQDISELVRQEMQLAKVELRDEVSKASKAGVKLGAGSVLGYLALLLASFAIVWGLAEVLSVGWGFLIVAVVYAIIAAVLFVTGRKQLRQISPIPRQTMETLKEDASWARAQAK